MSRERPRLYPELSGCRAPRPSLPVRNRDRKCIRTSETENTRYSSRAPQSPRIDRAIWIEAALAGSTPRLFRFPLVRLTAEPRIDPVLRWKHAAVPHRIHSRLQFAFRQPTTHFISHGELPSGILFKATTERVSVDFQRNRLVAAAIQKSDRLRN